MSKNIFSNEAFADWCEKQGEKNYSYDQCQECAIFQYLSSTGLPVFSVAHSHWTEDKNGKWIEHLFSFDWVDAASEHDNFADLAIALREKENGSN